MVAVVYYPATAACGRPIRDCHRKFCSILCAVQLPKFGSYYKMKNREATAKTPTTGSVIHVTVIIVFLFAVLNM